MKAWHMLICAGPLVDASFASSFHAGGELLAGVAWALAALTAVVIVLTRTIGRPARAREA